MLKTLGLRHLALWVTDLEACEDFYCRLLGMQLEWKPDPDNVYLTSGHDNLALHRAKADFKPDHNQHLDHFGFIIESMEKVDEWHDFLQSHDVTILMPPKTHRDGARSFYFRDPGGHNVQMIYHPPLVKESH